MGACVLCGKSAGLFYSLHKNCYQQFQSSSEPIVQLLNSQLESQSVAELVPQLQAMVQQLDFVEQARQRTLVRALETFAKQNFESEPYTVEASATWVKILQHLEIDNTLFLDSNFIAEQENLPLLAALRAGDLPACNCNASQFPIELPANESLWWRFSNVRLDQLQPKQSKRRWSIALQILQSSLPRKPKQAVAFKELGTGALWLTSQFLHFEKEQEVISIAYREIVAITPEFDGVTLQSKELQTRPQTFRCQESRLLYQFLRYALAAEN